MSLATRIIADVVFPAQEMMKGHSTVAVRKVLDRSQWWRAEQLDEFRGERLHSMISHAEQHVPYYRGLLADLRLTAADFRRPSDVAKLPFLTKALIRERSEQMKSDVAGKLARSNTGGSSGEPLIFYLGSERVSHDVAAKWRATRWWGVDIGDPEIVVWGSPIELGAQDRVRALRDFVFRTELLPAFEMSEQKLDGFVARIRDRRPRMLFGYPSSISLIAQHAASRGVKLDDLGVKVVFVTSERLYDEQRKVISGAFGCPVANGYGGRDAGFLAHECPHGGMHVTAEDVIIEIVSPGGEPLPPGHSGEIVVTHLASRDFPFIRYRTGDVGVMDDRACECGRGLPLLRSVEGRTTDFVVASDGTIMHGLALIYVIRDLPGIAAFKIVQESLEFTRVLVVPGPDFEDRCLQTIEDGLRRRLGQGVKIEVQRIDRIPAEKSGKFRYVVSHVAR
ncbi:MAG: phenylacetate--CoA ligase family protein [Betaproteobacteria bacterium]|nr:phenylacetate--CoA ligase family protein [Betaproteobacteria bacterium]